jgi:valine--pyruvate aminotransferase
VERLLAESVPAAEAIGAICVSRPTNPSGNVLTDEEIHRLDALAGHYEIPLIIDNAYGMPFPHIVFDEEIEGTVKPVWNENIILGMSLSKIGLPGARTGIVIARAEVITALSRANAVASLANTMAGQVITEPLLRDGRILSLARSVIRPYYYWRMTEGRDLLEKHSIGACPGPSIGRKARSFSGCGCRSCPYRAGSSMSGSSAGT